MFLSHLVMIIYTNFAQDWFVAYISHVVSFENYLGIERLLNEVIFIIFPYGTNYGIALRLEWLNYREKTDNMVWSVGSQFQCKGQLLSW